ncbi:MAG: lipopolysaccharide heptosyltransferase II [Xanthobacteraceae bacterium]
MAADTTPPILIVPYQWIGDFVRGHSVVKLLKSQAPGRPVDMLASSNAAPLADYMPGVRKAIVADLPRGQLAFGKHRKLSQRLAAEHYGQALVFPGTFKAALAPCMARVPKRSGLLGELRFGVLNDIRYDRARLPRMIDQCASLALPKGASLPAEWPLPELVVPATERVAWRAKMAPDRGRRVIALAPGAVGWSKRWNNYGALAAALVAQGHEVWIVGSPAETAQAQDIKQDVAGETAAALGQMHASGPDPVRDLTGTDLRNAILALAEADVVVSNDSGLLHVAAALGTPSIGIFGPTDPWLWAPLNPLAAVITTDSVPPCQPCHQPTCRLVHHRCMRDIATEKVLAAVDGALANPAARMAKIAAPESATLARAAG